MGSEVIEEKDAISIGEIFKVLLKKWWIIAASAIVCAIAAFTITFLFTTQTYKATGKMYVNNQSLSIGATKSSITSSDITANRSLTETYAIVLLSRTTLEKVITEVNLKDENGKDIYSYAKLCNMITVGAIDETEIMGVYVECANEQHALAITNAILKVFPEQVEKIIEGSSATIVDYAAEAAPVSRKLTTKAIIGFLIGAILSAGIILVIYIFVDDTIESSDWVKQNLGENIPLLSIIPDSAQHSNKKGYHYYYYDSEPAKDDK